MYEPLQFRLCDLLAPLVLILRMKEYLSKTVFFFV